MARSSTPRKKGCHETWKLDLHAPSTDSGTATIPSPPPPSDLSPLQCLHKGTGGSEQQWFSQLLTLADDGLIYKTASDINTAAIAVQEHLEKVSHWCQETHSLKSIQALWCTLNNKTEGQATPEVSCSWEIIEHTNTLRYLRIHDERMLTHKTQVESTKLRSEKWLKAMASKFIEQRHLFLLYQSVILRVVDYSLGLTTLSKSILLKLDRLQNEAMRVILGTTKDTLIEAMCYLLNLSPMETRHKVEQIKEYLNTMQNPKNPLHDAVKEEKGCRLARGKSWLGQAEQWNQHVCGFAELKQVRDWGKKQQKQKKKQKKTHTQKKKTTTKNSQLNSSHTTRLCYKRT